MDKDYVDERASHYLKRLKDQINENEPLPDILNILANLYVKFEEVERMIKLIKAQPMFRNILLPEAEKFNKGIITITIDAGFPLFSINGFYRSEYDSKGKPFRWTGPTNEFKFEINLNRTAPLIFELELLPGGFSKPDKIRCLVDDIEIPTVVERSDTSITHRGVIPETEEIGLTSIMFVCEEMYVPSEKDPNFSDTRRLGVVFRELRIFPKIREMEVT